MSFHGVPFNPLLALDVPSAESSQNVLDDMSMDISQAVMPTLEEVGQPFMINAHEMKDGGVQVMNVNTALVLIDDVVAEVIGLSVSEAALDPASGHPNRKTAWVMIATIVGGCSTLPVNGSAEFAAPNHQCVVKHAALFQVLDECSRTLIHLFGDLFVTVRKIGMVVPAAVIDLNKADAAFC